MRLDVRAALDEALVVEERLSHALNAITALRDLLREIQGRVHPGDLRDPEGIEQSSVDSLILRVEAATGRAW